MDSQSVQTPSSVHARRQKIVFKYILLSIGIFLTFAAYGAMVYLQSSINIEAGVGVASVTATYVTAAVFGVFITPALLRVLGAKACVIISEISYLFYVLVNFYPEAYLLIPAGAIAGIGEATMWPAMMLFCAHYAKCFARFGSKDTRFYVTEFIGYFYLSFQSSHILGSLVSYAIFYAGKRIEVERNDTQPAPVRDLSVCGANDCQDPNATQENLDQYKPATQTTLYITLGVMSGMVFIALCIHTLFIKDIDRSLEVQDDETDKDIGPLTPASLTEKLFFAFETSKKTVLHLFKPKQLFLTPFDLFCGLIASFGFGEMPRAFGSCMIGVDQTGLCMAIFAAADAIMSFITSKISSRYGRNIPILIGVVLNVGFFMICLFWIPTESSLWLVYILFAIIGVLDGIWQPLVNEMHASYFPECEEIAFSVWNLWVVIGIAIQFGWSISVCVEDKIYVQLGLLAVAVISYYVGEFYIKRKAREIKGEEKLSTEVFHITGTKL